MLLKFSMKNYNNSVLFDKKIKLFIKVIKADS